MSTQSADAPTDAHADGASATRAVDQPVPQNPVRSDITIELLGYWRILLKRQRLMAAIVVLALLAAAAVTVSTPRLYMSRVVIQIDREPARVLNVQDVNPTEQLVSGLEFFQTQYGLLQSRSLAVRVAESSGLLRNDDFIRQMGARPPSGGSPDQRNAARRELVVNLLTRHIAVVPNRGSRLVALTFTSPDPRLSAQIANAFAENFIATNLNRRFESTAYARSFLESRLQQTRASLNESERALVAYARTQDIIQLNDSATAPNSTGSHSLEASSLEAMNSMLAAAQGRRIEAGHRWERIRDASGSGARELLADPTVQQLTSRRAELSADYENRLSRFQPTYPDMIRLQQQIAEVDRSLQQQVAAIRRSVQGEYTAAINDESSLREHVQRLRGSVQDLRGRTIQYNILQRDVDTNRALYEGLLQRYKEVGVAGGVTANNIAIIDHAEPAPGPSSPRPLLNFAVALAGGIFIAVAMAFLVDALDQVLATPDEVTARIGLPILGVIPLAPKRAGVSALLEDRRSGLSESYYSLRSMLQFSTEAGFPRSLLVTSTGPGEGKSTTAYALATILARLGYRTVLVDADLRNPSLQREFADLHNQSGLTNLLTSLASLAEVVQDSGMPNLTVITSGPLPPSPAELLGTQTFHRTVAAISTAFDIVVIDGPPVMGLADAPLIAAAVNATLLVVEASKTGRTQALAAVGRLQMANAKLVGTVLTKFDLRNASYGYGYAYQYSYGYGGANQDGPSVSLLTRIASLLRR